MRVLIIAGGFPTPEKPDELVFVYNQVCQLAQHENITMIVPVPVFLFSKKGIYIREKRNFKPSENLIFKVYFTNFYIPFGKLGIYFYAYSQFLSVLLTVLLHRIKIDIIHGHFLYPEGFVAVLLSKLLNKAVINTAHGSDLLVYTTKKNRVNARIRFTLRQSDKIICVANMLREKAVHFGAEPERIKVIPNGVDTEVFSISAIETARKTTGLDLNTKIVLFIGQLIKRKNVHILLESIAQIVHSMVDESSHRLSVSGERLSVNTEHQTPNTEHRFVILGEGILKEQLRHRAIELGIENLVQFIGAKENTEIPVWINSADLICLPSLSEGLPCVLIESLACGVPVVATRVGGIAEIIQNKDLGLLVPSGNAKELALAIMSALEKDWDRKKIREYALAKYDWKTVTQQILTQYQTLH